MLNWQRISALQEFQQSATNTVMQDAGVSVSELPHSGKLVCQTRADDEAVQAALSAAIGQKLPLLPNTSTTSTHTILWMKPGKWMIFCAVGESRQLRKNLKSALAGFICMISDISDSRVGIEISGDDARALLSRVCALDLDARSFTRGQCAQTLLVRVPLLLHQVNDRPTFHLYVDRSVARYAWDWLCDAASEISSGANSGVNT